MTDGFLSATVILPVENVVDTANFYAQKLGFKIDTLWRDPPYAVVIRGNAMIEFGAARKQYAGSGVCYLQVADADAVYAEFKASGVEFLGDLDDRTYGCRDFRVRDNNGNMLIVGSPLPDREALLAAGNVA